MGLFGGLLGALGGGLLGGLLGGKRQVPQFAYPSLLSKFVGPLGTATTSGFTYSGPKELQPGLHAARTRISDILQGGLQVDPQRIKRYEEAWLNARLPFLERAMGEQTNRLNAALGARGQGLGTATSRTLRDTMESQNLQRMSLLNQAIAGGEHLADRALQQKLAELGALQGISQQDIGNQLDAFRATMGALLGQQGIGLEYNKLLNQLLYGQAAANNAARRGRYQDIISGLLSGFSLFG